MSGKVQSRMKQSKLRVCKASRGPSLSENFRLMPLALQQRLQYLRLASAVLDYRKIHTPSICGEFCS